MLEQHPDPSALLTRVAGDRRLRRWTVVLPLLEAFLLRWRDA